MRDEDIPEIRGLELFREVSDTAFDALMRATYLQAFPPGLALFEAGEHTDFLPVLLEGRVELFGTWRPADHHHAHRAGASRRAGRDHP